MPVKAATPMVKPIVKTPELKPLEASVSPDTNAVNEGVNKIMKKGKASTIMTGVMGDVSKPNVFKPLLGGDY